MESELSAARRALAARVVRHDDKLAHALLACLHLLAALHDRLAEDAGAEAIDSTLGSARELAGAARLITFTASAEDRELPLHLHTWGATPSRPTGPLLEEARRLLGVPDSMYRSYISSCLGRSSSAILSIIKIGLCDRN